MKLAEQVLISDNFLAIRNEGLLLKQYDEQSFEGEFDMFVMIQLELFFIDIDQYDIGIQMYFIDIVHLKYFVVVDLVFNHFEYDFFPFFLYFSKVHVQVEFVEQFLLDVHLPHRH